MEEGGYSPSVCMTSFPFALGSKVGSSAPSASEGEEQLSHIHVFRASYPWKQCSFHAEAAWKCQDQFAGAKATGASYLLTWW